MKKTVAFALAVMLVVSSVLIFIRRVDEGPIVIQPGHIGPIDVIAAERNFGRTGAFGHTGPDHEITATQISDILSANTARDGYILAPTIVGPTGIDSASSFILRTHAGYEEIEPVIYINGQPIPAITREDSNTFIITPAIPLSSNSVYVLSLTPQTGPDITWAFQTAVRFEITSTLPRHQSANVPVRTGIEVNFSFGDVPDIEAYFSIYPHVEGRFISRGSTAIFMPVDPLGYGQIYTVTISPGITSPDTGTVINSTRVFSFETYPDPSAQANWHGVSDIHFSYRYLEFPSFAAPSVSFWFNYNRERARPVIDVNIYRIENRTQAIAAVGRLAGIVSWSWLPRGDRLVDTAGLERITSSRITSGNFCEWGWNEVFELPTALPPGFYVLDATSGYSRDQVIIQITDLAVQVIADYNMAIVWANDMITGQPVAGTVRDAAGNTTYNISEYGIAVVERMIAVGEYIIVAAADGRENVVFVRYSAFQSFHGGWGNWGIMPRAEASWDFGGWDPWWRPAPPANSYYWTALQLDRTLFQRNDTLSLWGFAQNRRRHEDITHVTAIITESTWWHPERDTLVRQNIPVTGGAYSGEIRLPHLDPGFYELTVYHGDIALNTIHFSVMDYVTPPYRLSVLASHRAVFAGDEVRFTARTEFFEGTPVPDLDITYDFWGWELRAPNSGRERTNSEGVIERQASPTATDANVQGERNLGFSVNATLPEIGWTHQQANVRVFVNDIHVRPRATREGRAATLTVNVHDITLDRINDQTAAHWGDFLCAPRAGQRLDVRVYEVYWVAVRIGERYCHITRQVVPRYRHEQRERHLESFQLTTDAEGTVTRDFTVPDHEHRSYEARITTTDGNGRRISHTAFIGRDFSHFFRNADEGQPFLYGVRDGYDIGDEVELTVMRGLEPLTQGNILFVTVQNGILSYSIGVNPLVFTFGEQHVPNAQVFAIHFNGHTYHTGGRMAERLRFNPSYRQLVIDLSSCAETYRPGDMATFNVTIADLSGNPKAAHVNISLVDEALFALMDYTVDTLATLYGTVNDRLRFGMATHWTFLSDGIDDENMYGMAFRAAAPGAPESVMAMDMAAEADSGGGDGAHIRERFEDTAVFASLQTNVLGQATFTFPLPDNITSWRVTASAISNDLYAGNTVQNIRVTQPMFLHYTLNNIFLVGDTPYIGVNAFGTSLTGGERVEFEVWREDTPEDIRRTTGVSFERVNIPLWEKTSEGFGAIVVRASVAGYSDAVRHPYQVISSHRQVDIASFYEVTPDTVFAVNPAGLTNITFTDHGRGQFLNSLFGLRHIWRSGARIEGLVARREATALIRSHFPDMPLFGEAGDFDVLEYQTYSGGIAILPYANADLLTTVMLIPFIMDDVNTAQLSGFLRQAATGTSSENRILALYGLAMLGEPVLLDLQRYALLDGLGVRDTAYIALGLAAIGEVQTARELYANRIASHIQSVAPYYRVNVGANRRDIYNATSVVAILAAQLGMPESIGLHNYAMRNSDPTLLMNIERLKFISRELNNHTGAAASITYTLFGETVTRDLGHGGQFTLRIPTGNMHEFNLVSTSGQVGAVSITRVPLEDMEAVDNDITIRRQFFRAGSNTPATVFEQDELVRVQISIDYSRRALSGSYVITDFLPAGLALVPNSARFGRHDNSNMWWAWATAEGQRVTFFDFNGRFDRVHTYYYYARVINPGVFVAEGAMVQSIGAREYLAVGESAVITINT